EVKVADFGIAKANQRVRQTQLGMVKGTAAYMAPEHRIGKPVDRRADGYGVGAIIHELLAGTEIHLGRRPLARRAAVYGGGAIIYELLAGTEINLALEALAHLGVEGWPHLPPLSQV